MLLKSAAERLLIEGQEKGNSSLISEEIDTKILEVESANVNSDKVLEGDITEGSLIGNYVFENGKVEENGDSIKNEAEEAESDMLNKLNKCEDMLWEEKQEKQCQ